MNKKLPLRSWLTFAFATITFSGCAPFDLERNPSDLAKFIPEDAWLIATIRPGQIQTKMDYDSFIHMPAIAFGYSTLGIFESVDPEDQSELDMAVYLTHMIENPSKSGIELKDDSFFFAGKASMPNREQFMPSLPTFGFVLPLADHEKFETMIELMLEVSRENDEVRRSSRNGKRMIEHEHWFLVIAEGMAFFKGTALRNSIDAEETIRALESPQEIESSLAKHLRRPFDAGIHMEMGGYLDWMILLAGDPTELPDILIEQMRDVSFSFEVTGEAGQLVVRAGGSYGDTFPYHFSGGGVGEAMLGILPDDSVASATLSINMETIRKGLSDISEKPGGILGMPPMHEPISSLGLTLDEALSAFTGNISASLIELPKYDESNEWPPEIPNFVLALETVDPASKVYQKILKNKLLDLFDKNVREPLQALGVSLVAHENRLILGSSNQAELLKSGKTSNPINEDARKILAKGYANLVFDFGKVSEILPLNRRDLAYEEQIVYDAIDLLDKVSFQSAEEQGGYEMTLVLSSKNKETNFFKQLASFIANAIDPAWLDPEIRLRMEAARTLAVEQPEYFKNGLLGTWKSKWTDEEDEESYSINKFIHKEEGTYSGESINFEKEGYSLDEYEGTWKVIGASFLTYDENGLLEWVGGILEVEDERFEYYNIWEPFKEFELSEDHRVPEDWNLPNPPEGLRKLSNEGDSDFKEEEVGE